jgi:DNA-binding GntR family transcriptional regulator
LVYLFVSPDGGDDPGHPMPTSTTRRRAPTRPSGGPRPGDGLVAPADACDRVRQLIVRGDLPPGARVAEAELAAKLGVSRTPAREAMRRLVAEGLLVPDGGGERPRLRVAPVGPDDVRQLYEAAGALEGVVMRRLTDLPLPARRALAKALRDRERAFRRAARVRPLDYDKLFVRHDAFHRALMDALAGPTTRVLLETLRPRLDRYEWLYAPLIGPDFSETYAEHAAIIRAVTAGDGPAAERAVRRNWFKGGERLAACLPRAAAW